jgi:hypothetical protein
MDFRIYRKEEDIDSTGYIEIGPGKYSGKHWNEGFLFIWEDAFGMAEGIIAKHFPDYDHFSMNDLSKVTGQRIIADWREVATKMESMTPDEIHSALNLDASYRTRLDEEIVSSRDQIAEMLGKLADECNGFYQKEDWICVLGV